MVTPVRGIWLKIHRWLGLTLAAFLVMAGLTGVVLAFHEDLDAWLNPHLFRVQPRETRLQPHELRARAEQLMPEARVDSVPLGLEPSESALFYVRDRIDPATGKPYPRAVNQLFVDPYTGEEVGRRLSSQLSLDREHIMETIFTLHRHLLMGDAGSWVLVFVAIAWFVSSLIGFYLTFPLRGKFFKGWKAAWRVQWGAPLPRLSFDLHRATALWLFIMIFISSFGAMRVTLGDTGVFDKILAAVAPVHTADAAIAQYAQPIEGEPKLTWEAALPLARHLMAERARLEGFEIEGEASLSLDRETGVYDYSVRSSNDAFDSGETDLYLSAVDGRELALVHPNSAPGNALSSWPAALHRARIGSLPYKVLVQLTGLAVTTLAITGFIVWFKRRKARA